MPNINKSMEFNEILSRKTVRARVSFIANHCQRPVFTTSLGLEDQFLTWQIASTAGSIKLVTLQTGRLFLETLDLLQKTQEQLHLDIEQYTPPTDELAEHLAEYGEFGFYDSIEARKACCYVRKVLPLKKALQGADGWVTGLTRAQSEGRGDIPFTEWDNGLNIMKFNPLADIDNAEITAAIEKHNIPINELHQRGYPSIGCEPCTRAVKPGEHPRAGRWWWENNASSECGLHTNKTSTAKLKEPA